MPGAQQACCEERSVICISLTGQFAVFTGGYFGFCYSGKLTFFPVATWGTGLSREGGIREDGPSSSVMRHITCQSLPAEGVLKLGPQGDS